jgi:hypothetical protein
LPAGRGRDLFSQALIPECRGPPEIADVVFHQCGQIFHQTAEHALQALGDVLLPRAVHTDAFHAVSVTVAARLYTGAIIDQFRQTFGGGGFFRATFHEFLNSSTIVSATLSNFFRKNNFFHLMGQKKWLECASPSQIEDRMP